jgi:hypothetical protein
MATPEQHELIQNIMFPPSLRNAPGDTYAGPVTPELQAQAEKNLVARQQYIADLFGVSIDELTANTGGRLSERDPREQVVPPPLEMELRALRPASPDTDDWCREAERRVAAFYRVVSGNDLDDDLTDSEEHDGEDDGHEELGQEIH